MEKKVKYLFYLLICIVAFFVSINVFDGSLNKAAAFEWEKRVEVYFGNTTKGSAEDCSKVFPISRVVLNAETLGPGALEAMLRGVTDESEKRAGYFSSLNDGVLIQKFDIVNKVAYVDFNSRFNEMVGGSCRVIAIRSQVEKTLTDLPDIDSVVMSVDGQTEGILEP